MLHDWQIHASEQETGWLMNSNGTCLLFALPPRLMEILPTPPNTLSIGPGGSLSANYQDLLLGDHWHQCFISERPL